MVVWSRLVGFLLVGYLCLSRSFAYLGIPPLFIGEIALGAFLLFKPRVLLGTWTASLLRASPLNALGLALLLFVLYGVWEVGRGVAAGIPLGYTLKFFIFNYYALYTFLGLWIGIQMPNFLSKAVRVVAWTHGIYALSWILVLRDLRDAAPVMPGTDLSVFGMPDGGAIVLLGLLCFERNLRMVWPVVALNIAVTLAGQGRASWLGLAVGVLLWGFLTRKLGRVAAIGAVGLALVSVIGLSGIQFGSRGSSFGDLAGRLVAPFDMELAKELSPTQAEHAAGTVEWRQKWWEEIWRSVHSRPVLELFGHGYGFHLWGLAPLEVREFDDRDIRTPHNVFYYALGYTGWVGVAMFAFWQFTILRLLWQSFQVTGQPAGLVYWVSSMTMACFEAGFDTPYRAIPFYLLMGMTIAPGLQSMGEWHARAARAQLLPVAGR
jgi:hypothetical protein